MSDEITEDVDFDGDGSADGTVTWTDGGGDSQYYEQGAIDADGDGNTDYEVADTDEDGTIDQMSGDFDGDGGEDSWEDTDGDHTVDQDEIEMS